MSNNLIQVHIGSVIPDYLIDNVYQTLLTNKNLNIYIVLSDKLISNFKFYLNDINISTENVILIKASDLDLLLDIDPNYMQYKNIIGKYNLKEFRDSFWISTSSRFFYIKACMSFLNIENCFHIENDIMIYHDLKDFDINSLNKIDGIYMVKDSTDRVIPSVMYYPSLLEAENLCNHITETLKLSGTFVNDMNILATYKNLIQFNHRPDCQNPDGNLVFDGASLGQFLGGIDPKNIPNYTKLTELNNPTRSFINETCDFKVTDYSIKKIRTFQDFDYKHFTINNKKIVNLHIHSKQLYQFSSIFDILYDDIISGDRIVSICDIIFSTHQIHQFHRNIEHLDHKKIIIDPNHIFQNNSIMQINDIINQRCPKDPIKIFIYTHIYDSVKRILVHPLFNRNREYVLYLHNSDHSFDDVDILSLKHIKHVFAQNVNIRQKSNDFDDPKVTLLPISIGNQMWPHGSLLDLYEVMSSAYRIKKKNGIYININPITFPYRATILKQCIELGLPIHQSKPFKEYLLEMSRYKYCLCLRGNGLDTHRFWESLYLGTIPIILNDVTTNMSNFIGYLKKLGIQFIEIKHSLELLDLIKEDKMHKFKPLQEQLKIGYYE